MGAATFRAGEPLRGGFVKKHRTQVPDFSHKKRPSLPGIDDPKLHQPVPRAAPQPKPRATSAKSGRRGQ
jgi:hypothetical protein